MTTPQQGTATLTALVAAEIRASMGRMGVRQSELARKLGESDQWLSMRLRGRTPLDINEILRISRALGVDLYQLLPSPEVVAQAADSSATVAYLPLAERLAITARPRDNRPPGRPSTPGSDGVGRTAYLSRSARRKTA
jgi:transcriptional regulator with XRE-family HTH domain